MNFLTVAVVTICESVGVGLVGAVVLRLLRQYPVGYSLIAVVVITVCAMNTSVITVVVVTQLPQLPVALHLVVNLVAGVVSIGIGVLFGRSVTAGGRRLADATRALGQHDRLRLPDDDETPTAELTELARELRITSDKLDQSRRREQATEASRRKLVSWISHDLRSPLARLSLVTESIEDGVTDDLPSYCRSVRAETETLIEMVDDLFELSRIQSGTLNLTPRIVALDDLISDEVAGLEAVTKPLGIRLQARRIESVNVRVDDRMMTRVFNNLLANAIQYSPVNTTVSVDVVATDGLAVVLVSDECGGISPGNLGSVFDMGWRGNSDSHSAKPGGGLGLSIVQGIVQAHQGHVSVRNVPGGCCFEVRLPLVSG